MQSNARSGCNPESRLVMYEDGLNSLRVSCTGLRVGSGFSNNIVWHRFRYRIRKSGNILIKGS